MKELSIEQKAKRYDEAKARMSRAYNSNRCTIGFMNEIFPELKENEDEKIKKTLIDYFITYKKQEECGINTFFGIPTDNVIAWLEKQGNPQVRTGPGWVDTIDNACDERYAEEYSHGEYCHEQSFKWGFQEGVEWLEKQGEQKPAIEMKSAEESLGIDSKTYNEIVDECIYGEQKPTDKVEPKFKVGDWILYSGDHYEGVRHITKINENGYYIERNGLPHGIIPFNHEICMRLWTIQDAKDGDILIAENIIFIYKKALASHIVSYCKLINDVFEPTVDARTCCEGNPYVYPATKEQRDLLFSKMREFGYEWDTKEKQLMKFPRKVQATGVLKQLIDEQKSVDVEEPNFFADFRNSDVEVDSNEDGLIAETIKYKNEKQGEQKPTDKVKPKLDEIEIPFGAKDSELQEAVYNIPKGFYSVLDGNKVIIKRFKTPIPQNN